MRKLMKRVVRKKKKIVMYLFPIIFISLFLFSNNIGVVKADINYSNYLVNESISVEKDRALILLESSLSSNNYRNYYERNFLFPNRLSKNMYTTEITTNPSNYYLSQVYLDNLDSEYAFKNVETTSQYQSNVYIQDNSEIVINKGLYNNMDNASYYILIPNHDYQVSGYSGSNINEYPVDNDCFYDDLDDYPNLDDNYYLVFTTGLEYMTLGFNTSEINNNVKFYYFEVCTLIENDVNYVWLSISDNGVYSNQYYFDNYYYSDWTENQLNITQTINNIQDLRVRVLKLDDLVGFQIEYLYIKAYYYFNDILEYDDINSYNYKTTGQDNFGHYPSGYILDSEVGLTDTSIDFIDSETLSICEVREWYKSHYGWVYMDSGGAYQNAIHSFTSQKTSGYIEFWMFVNETNKDHIIEIQQDSSNEIYLYFRDNGYIAYYDTSVHNIQIYLSLTWYHFCIYFDCTGSKWYLWIDDISKDGGSGYNFKGSPTYLDKFKINLIDSYAEVGIDGYDESWLSGYFLHRNFDDISYIMNISSSLKVDYVGNEFDNLEVMNLQITSRLNTSLANLDLYCKNRNTDNYDLVMSESLSEVFQTFEYSYAINYTYFTYQGVCEFNIIVSSYSNSLIYFDMINLNCFFNNYTINNNGYHSIECKFIRQTSTSIHRGNSTIYLNLYKTNFTYMYIENNLIENDYSKTEVVDFSGYIDTIKELEIQCHIRYGLNTLDINIVNVYYLIMINYNFTYEIYEQNRIGNNDGNYFRYKFGYTPNNFIRLNLTGIYGNYSYSVLSGMRVLRSNVEQVYNRYFTIPYFDQKIDLAKVSGAIVGGAGASEPELPYQYYWEYTSYRLTEGILYPTTVGNWTIDFQSITNEQYQAKYPYNPKSIDRSDLGSRNLWEIKINDEWKISFVFLRNAIADIINLLMLFGQLVIFLGVWGASFIGMYLGTLILVFLFNIPLYYLWFGLLWLVWYLYVGLWYVWQGLVWVYENLFIPFLEWVNDVLLPWLLIKILEGLAWCITAFIWLITFGQINFNETYDLVYEILCTITNEILEIITVFVDNLFYILLFFVLYIYNLVILYFSYLYAKSRGMNKKAEKFYSTLMFYLTPFTLLYDWIRKITDLSPM